MRVSLLWHGTQSPAVPTTSTDAAPTPKPNPKKRTAGASTPDRRALSGDGRRGRSVRALAIRSQRRCAYKHL